MTPCTMRERPRRRSATKMRAYLTKAIAMAQAANLPDDVARLTARRKQIAEIYNRQFRSVGYS